MSSRLSIPCASNAAASSSRAFFHVEGDRFHLRVDAPGGPAGKSSAHSYGGQSVLEPTRPGRCRLPFWQLLG